MSQAPAYSRVKNFAGNPGNNTDNAAINAELDKVAASISGLRTNLGTLQNDDGSLRAKTVGADALTDDAREELITATSVVVTADAQSAATSATAAESHKNAAAESATAAAAALAVLQQANSITYATLTEGGTYAMAAGLGGVHHVGTGIDTNNPHNINQYVADATTTPAAEALVINPQFPWQHNASLTMAGPRTDQVPQWYKNDYPTYNEFEWCRHGLAWYVCMEAAGNTATNTRVQIRNLRTLYLSNATKTWQEVDLAARPAPEEWTYPFQPTGNGDGDAREEADGGISVKPDYPLFNHGYGYGHALANPADIRATMVSMEFRLIKDNPAGVDDRANAKYVVDCGIDWRPGFQDDNEWHEWPTDWVPGVGNSRMLLATNEWRGAAMLIPNDWHGCTYEELLNNPPPFAINASPGTADTTVVLPTGPANNQVAKFVSVAPIQKFRVMAADGDNGDYTINLPADTEIAFRFRLANRTWYRFK